MQYASYVIRHRMLPLLLLQLVLLYGCMRCVDNEDRLRAQIGHQCQCLLCSLRNRHDRRSLADRQDSRVRRLFRCFGRHLCPLLICPVALHWILTKKQIYLTKNGIPLYLSHHYLQIGVLYANVLRKFVLWPNLVLFIIYCLLIFELSSSRIFLGFYYRLRWYPWGILKNSALVCFLPS